MDEILEIILRQPWAFLGLAAVLAGLVVIVAFKFLNNRFNKVMERIDSAITGRELDEKMKPLLEKLEECVTQDKLKLALYEQKEKLDKQIQETRHSLRNELNPVFLKFSASLETLHTEVAELRGEVRALRKDPN